MHDGGLEVILDVVYNHTAEGNEFGPTLSFKGIDNRSYYRLISDQPRYYVNDTGTGNTLNLSHPRVIQMVADSLRYWVSEMRVDGFRFDLGTILAREPDGFKTESGFLKAIGQDPLLAEVKLIAEPWDCGPGGYQVGGFPPGWAEWNDTFRDAARDYWRGMASAKTLLPVSALRPTSSISAGGNPGRASISSPRTTASPCAISSPTTTSTTRRTAKTIATATPTTARGTAASRADRRPEIRSLRCRQIRNLLATLMLSQGTPMIAAGDEIGRTQNGNNNAYCQDDEISWVNWRLDEEQQALVALSPPHGALPSLSRPAPVALLHRRDGSGHRRQGRDLDRRQRLANDARDLGQRADALFRHASRRAGADDRHQASRQRRHAVDRLQRASRYGQFQSPPVTRRTAGTG